MIRDCLFLSYAWEDGALCEWLYRKLTAAGYLVWCDRFKLLGGERWPKDIDVAIKTRTFRMIALLSRCSLAKDNPRKERQLALALSKDRKEDFLIPLNVDGVTSTEVGWELSDINYISFTEWAPGLRQLLAKLASLDAPRPLGDRGAALAIDTYVPVSVLRDAPEHIYGNCLAVTAIPARVKHFSLSRPLAEVELHSLARVWAFKQQSAQQVLAFTPAPPKAVPQCEILEGLAVRWRDEGRINGVWSPSIVKELVRRSLIVKCVERGMVLTEDGSAAYFPPGLLPKDRITYTSYKGRETRVSVLGERRAGKDRIRFQLGISFWIRDDVLSGALAVETKVRLQITDPSGAPLDWKVANRRRKQIAKSWWNHDWLSRQLALVQYLAAREGEIRVGVIEDEQVRVAGELLTMTATPSINDAALEALRVRVQAMTANIDELDDQEPVESAHDSAP